MSIIRVEDLAKIYRIVEKDPGIVGSVKALFRPRYKEISQFIRAQSAFC